METQDFIRPLLRRACRTSLLQRYVLQILCRSLPSPQPGDLNPWRLHLCYIPCSTAECRDPCPCMLVRQIVPVSFILKKLSQNKDSAVASPVYGFPAVRLGFAHATAQRAAGAGGAAGWWPRQGGHAPRWLSIQKPPWLPKLVRRGSRQLWEPRASRACAGALCKTGCIPCQGNPCPSHDSPGSKKGEN